MTQTAEIILLKFKNFKLVSTKLSFSECKQKKWLIFYPFFLVIEGGHPLQCTSHLANKCLYNKLLPPFGVGALPVWEIVDLALDANTIFDAVGQWTPHHHIRILLSHGNPFSYPHVSFQIRFLGTPIRVQQVNWDINQLRSSCSLPQSSSRMIHEKLVVQIPLDVFAAEFCCCDYQTL